MLNDLSNFNSVRDYFPIIVAGLIVDMFVLCLVLVGYINVKSLNQWYNQFQLLAVVADVFSIVIGIIIARFIYPFFFKSHSPSLAPFGFVAGAGALADHLGQLAPLALGPELSVRPRLLGSPSELAPRVGPAR